MKLSNLLANPPLRSCHQILKCAHLQSVRSTLPASNPGLKRPLSLRDSGLWSPWISEHRRRTEPWAANSEHFLTEPTPVFVNICKISKTKKPARQPNAQGCLQSIPRDHKGQPSGRPAQRLGVEHGAGHSDGAGRRQKAIVIKDFSAPPKRKQTPNTVATISRPPRDVGSAPLLMNSRSRIFPTAQARHGGLQFPRGNSRWHFPPCLPLAHAWTSRDLTKELQPPASLTSIKLGFHF